LARKFKVKTLAKVFGMFGRDLGCDIKAGNGEEKRISIFGPADFTKKSIMNGTNPSQDPFAGIDKV
jgi:hypothetical protein